MAQKFRALLDLCRRRGFLYQSAEIYGGLRGAYDYGPLGVELKKNILNSWWRRHVYYRDDVVGLDTSIITPHPVLKASGHVDEFTDLLVDCNLTKERFRPDKAPEIKLDKHGNIPIIAPDKTTALEWKEILEKQIIPNVKMSVEGNRILIYAKEVNLPDADGQNGSITFEMWNEQPSVQLAYHGYVEPNTNSPFLTDSRPFNLMFKTFLDPIDPIERVIQTTLDNAEQSKATIRQTVDDQLKPSTVFLRPETAQGVFVNFEQIVRTMKKTPPFGIAQVGKSFRNEIRLEHGIFRTPEFEQMELEYFVSPWEATHYFEYWRKERYNWWLEHACHPENFRQRDHTSKEMAHYATGCTDVEYLFPWGWGEIEGVAHRGGYDLAQHIKNTGANFEITDANPSLSERVQKAGNGNVDLIPTEKPAKYIPNVIESSCGLNRAMLAYLCDAFHEVDEGNGKPPRTVLRLDPRLAPIKCAVMPLVGKPELNSLSEKVAKTLRRKGWYTVVESQKLKIGKRYYRHDEIGTPWCVTVDYQSLEDDTVTIRDRDTGNQERVHWKEVNHVIDGKLMKGEADNLLV
ncbi:glycyl-tRNA synthetase [Mycotypha africana]|uniref:glycyl-tRNA synthetase n=1 Tax=Mycotypha africana TaxID=64632 RepID=UPI002301A591|nr:glycyl-tRNA synthetase [Mycotypha africana]KAI8967797.1 glycyl-tRNA synthetase [Mycotypha africana]